MTDPLVEKSRAAPQSAYLHFQFGDFDGCADRVYYAMFDAARAYLRVPHGVALAKIKTHSGLLSAFSRFAVLADGLDPDLGRALNRATVRRATADYDERALNEELAKRLLDDMKLFLSAVLGKLESSGEGATP